MSESKASTKAVWTRAGVAAAGAALLVGGLTACGGNDAKDGKDAKDAKAASGKAAESKPSQAPSPAEAIKAAYRKTAGAKFAKIALKSTDADGKAGSITGTVGWNPASHDITLKDADGSTHSVMVGSTFYADNGAKGAGVGKKRWTKMDLGAGKLNENPAEYLATLLDAENIQHVGAEPVDGTAAEHYKATLTTEQALKADQKSKLLTDQQRKELTDALKKAAYKTSVFDVWIGEDGYPVRVDVARTDAKGTEKNSARFSDFGTAPAVKAPPADQVADFDDVLNGKG
ncbi:hypothetical protein AB0A77_22910 [Streptomyces varsoviensis]|uniref:hypothetical protein n=1 Tax=Streptomyces varsoviensis TaxID=67373 RepID=UPI0033E92908